MEFIGSFALTFAAVKFMPSWRGNFNPITGKAEPNAEAGQAVIEVEAAKMIFCLAFFTWAGISVSGAHYNPVVTVAMFLSKKVVPTTAVLFLIAQAAGAAAAGILQLLLTAPFRKEFIIPKDSSYTSWHYFLPSVHKDCNFVQAFVCEAIATFIFVLAYIAMMVDKRAPKGVNCFCVGCAYGLAYLTVGYYTGACLNPFIYIFPRLFTLELGDILVYSLAPLAGGVVAPIYYRFMVHKEPDTESSLSNAQPIKDVEI